ncbi:MAG: GspE/PulE family protein [Methylacidiphilales bacterium]|nr:GspE/PulE family protein [Candidatus Methylacidiphilales bacterium]
MKSLISTTSRILHEVSSPSEALDYQQLSVNYQVISFGECARNHIIPILVGTDQATVILSQKTNQNSISLVAIRLALKGIIVTKLHCISSEQFEQILKHEEKRMSALGLLKDEPTSLALESEEMVSVISASSISLEESDSVQFVNALLYEAYKTKASDIHLERSRSSLGIRFRLDGVMVQMRSVSDIALAEKILSRVKVMADLDIAERRVPQDGRFRVSIDSRAIDFRVSCMPNLFGEDAVLRLLDRQQITTHNNQLHLSDLGFMEEQQKQIFELAKKPYGMLLVTGPTGSGKTTTLYALLNAIAKPTIKTITIEDPIEYQLTGVLQIPVNEKKGLTFAKGLRSILRHDPDTIMVGEIRDAETAQIAVQSALTGHLVLSSIHANNVFDVLGRLNHMGIESFTLASSINGVISQRLLRKLCKTCKDIKRGCEDCQFTGYKGRIAVAEICIFTDAIKTLVHNRADKSAIEKVAKKHGYRSMLQITKQVVKRGITTIEEVERVVGA